MKTMRNYKSEMEMCIQCVEMYLASVEQMETSGENHKLILLNISIFN